MFDYRAKPVKVEAVQWEADMKPSRLPYWLIGALDLSDNHLFGKAKRVGEQLQVVTATGTIIAGVGDWIVYNSSTTRDLSVYSPSDFDRKFEVDERRRSRLRSWSDIDQGAKR